MSIHRDATPANERKWLEVKIEGKIRDYVKNEYKGIAYKFNSPQRASVPDRLIALPLRHLFFMEIKRWGETPTPQQFREAERILELKYKTYFVDNFLDAKYIIDSVMKYWEWPHPWLVSPPNKKYTQFWALMRSRGLLS